MDQAIEIIGQAVLLLAGLSVAVMLVVFILACVRAMVRLARDIRAERPPLLPETDSYLPQSFDLPGR
jgi:hypothetical protein